MNPGGQGGLFKVPSLGVPEMSSLSTRRLPPMGQSGGVVRIPHTIASKFPIKQEPSDVSMVTTSSVSLYLCETGQGKTIIGVGVSFWSL